MSQATVDQYIEDNLPSNSKLEASELRTVLKTGMNADYYAQFTAQAADIVTAQAAADAAQATADANAIDIAALEVLMTRSSIAITPAQFNALNAAPVPLVALSPNQMFALHSAYIHCVSVPNSLTGVANIELALISGLIYGATKVMATCSMASATLPELDEFSLFSVSTNVQKLREGEDIYLSCDVDPTDWNGNWRVIINYSIVTNS